MNLTLPHRRTGHEGRGLELLILASQTDVLLTKIPLSARRLPGGKVIAQCGPVDVMGIHKPTGRMLCFDAKECKNPYRLATRDKELKEHQRLEIIRYGEAGAIAGLLAECTANDELFWCDWKLLRTRRPSIPWAEMTPLGSSKFAVAWDLIWSRP